jgi:transposase
MARKPLQISSEQRSILEKLSKSSKNQMAKRASIILALAEEGMTHESVAKQLGTIRATVRRWRKRFEVEGIQGLYDVIRSGAPRRELMMSDRERAELERFVQRSRINHHLAFRSKIILKSAQNLSNLEVARQLRCSTSTITKWRKRFIENGVDGLLEKNNIEARIL